MTLLRFACSAGTVSAQAGGEEEETGSELQGGCGWLESVASVMVVGRQLEVGGQAGAGMGIGGWQGWSHAVCGAGAPLEPPARLAGCKQRKAPRQPGVCMRSLRPAWLAEWLPLHCFLCIC